jgi:tRNA A-37 threonylcarbamoyl transferase component Bud32
VAQPETLRRIAEGREAELFAWEDGTVLRLLRNAEGQARNELQRTAIRAAAASGVRVPAVHGTVTVMDRPGLVMERLDGPDLLTVIGRQPWKVLWVGGRSGEAHARLHEAAGPDSLPALRDMLRRAIERSDRVPEHLAAFALDVLDGLPDADHLYHGDFHPGNLMLSGGAPVVIDWPNAARGDPDADVARTLLLLRLGEPPPGTSLALRLLARVGRRLLVFAYLRAYRRRRALDPDRLTRWEIAQAAERLADGIDSERPALLRLLERRLQQG